MTLIKAFLTHFTYLALLLVLLAAGMGVPIPEDVPLIFSGYLCNPQHSPVNDLVVGGHARAVPQLWLMIIAGMVGVLGGDSMVFFIGRRGIDGNNFVARHLRKVLHSKRRERVERHFTQHGLLTVFAGRFMPGLRSLVFAMAGLSKMSYLKFILVDGFAALISVPTFILAGWYFADRINWVLSQVKVVMIPLAVGIAVVAIVTILVRRRRLKPVPVVQESKALPKV